MLRILIIDDVETNRFVLRNIITDMGYQVRCLDNLSTGKIENVNRLKDRDNYTFIPS